MKLEKRKPSGREKGRASVALLEQLREKLYCNNISAARHAAFNLSWMQEDGLDILKEALFGDVSERTKSAAAYGLRNMQGRMKNMALQVFNQGLKHSGGTTIRVCKKALSLLKEKAAAGKKPHAVRFEIKEIPSKDRQKSQIHKKSDKESLLPEQDSLQQ